jgi:spore maturation protein CgeB
MYRVLQSSKITFNHHGDVAPFANNMRLFEATGVGTCLLTDWKENLKEMFEPGKEVLTYRGPDECAELIQYYLDHEEERQAIGLAGQTRTLREHTYDLRMQEFVSMVGAHV